MEYPTQMDHPTALGGVHKTFKEKLRPTPEQEQALDVVVWRCRTLYNAALEQRKTAWERCHVSVTRYAQEAELKGIRDAFPEYAAVHSHVLQDVLARLNKAYQAFFRRLSEGEKPGYPRFQGRRRYHSFTYKEYGNGARLDRDENAARNIKWLGQSLRGVPAVAGAVNREPAGL
jgi:transposase